MQNINVYNIIYMINKILKRGEENTAIYFVVLKYVGFNIIILI